MTDLQRGMEWLGAVRVGRGKYAYYHNSKGICVVDATSVRALGYSINKSPRWVFKELYEDWEQMHPHVLANSLQKAKYEETPT